MYRAAATVCVLHPLSASTGRKYTLQGTEGVQARTTSSDSEPYSSVGNWGALRSTVSLMASRVAAMSAGLSSWRSQASCSENTRGGVPAKYRSTVLALPQPPAHHTHVLIVDVLFVWRYRSGKQALSYAKRAKYGRPCTLQKYGAVDRSLDCQLTSNTHRWNLTFVGVAGLLGGDDFLQQRAQLADAAACRRRPQLRGGGGEEALRHT